MCDVNFRQRTEYLESCYESWKAVLDKFDSLLKSVRSLSPNPGEALQRLIDEAKAKLVSKRDELEKLYDCNVELLRQGIELHETAPIVIRLEVNWSQLIRTAWASVDASNAALSSKDQTPFHHQPFHQQQQSDGSYDPLIAMLNAERSTANSPCLFGSIGSGLSNMHSSHNNNNNNLLSAVTSNTSTMSSSSATASSGLGSSLRLLGGGSSGTVSAEPFLNCFVGGSSGGGGGGLLSAASSADANNNLQHSPLLGGNIPLQQGGDSNNNMLGFGAMTSSNKTNNNNNGGFEPWAPCWDSALNFAALKLDHNDAAASSLPSPAIATGGNGGKTSGVATSSSVLFNDLLSNIAHPTPTPPPPPPPPPPAPPAQSGGSESSSKSFSSIVSSDVDRSACFDWLFSCLKDWRAKKLHQVPFDLLLENCLAHNCIAEQQRLWRVLQGETVEHLAAFMKQYPAVFALNHETQSVSLVMSAPADGSSTLTSEVSDVNKSSNEDSQHQPTSSSTPHGKSSTSAVPKTRRSGSLLEMDDFGNTSTSSSTSSTSNNAANTSSSSSSAAANGSPSNTANSSSNTGTGKSKSHHHHNHSGDHSDGGSAWQEVVKKVAKTQASRPNPGPCATDIRERIIDVLELTSHGANLAKLIAVEILRRAVKENAVPRDLTAESIERLRAYLPNALSSARGKLARPKPNLPPEHADWTYKTKLCVQFATTRQCTMAAQCRFAHGLVELRPKRRAEFCSYWKKSGSCPRRDSCQYAHSNEELGQFVGSHELPLTPSATSTTSSRLNSSMDAGSLTRPALSIQPATMSISLTSPVLAHLNKQQQQHDSPNSSAKNSTDSGANNNNENSSDGGDGSCWLCKGQRRGVPSKQLKCGHKYHSQCLNKFTKKQQSTLAADVSLVAGDAASSDQTSPISSSSPAVCPKCRTVAIAAVAVNV